VAYEIWDEGNRLGRFADKAKALKAVRILLEDDPGFEDSLVLVSEAETGRSTEVASGRNLSRLARPRVPA
jgi:hypothetical protein